MQHESEMTLPEANILLGSIGYRADWSEPELIDATAHLSPPAKSRISIALRVTAAAAFAEANALEAEGQRR